MSVNISMKFHEDILSGHDFVTDGQTDNLGKNNMSPNPKGGRHNSSICSEDIGGKPHFYINLGP